MWVIEAEDSCVVVVVVVVLIVVVVVIRASRSLPVGLQNKSQIIYINNQARGVTLGSKNRSKDLRKSSANMVIIANLAVIFKNDTGVIKRHHGGFIIRSDLTMIRLSFVIFKISENSNVTITVGQDLDIVMTGIGVLFKWDVCMKIRTVFVTLETFFGEFSHIDGHWTIKQKTCGCPSSTTVRAIRTSTQRIAQVPSIFQGLINIIRNKFE